MARDAKIGSGTTFTIRLAKNFPLDINKNVEIGGKLMGVMMKQLKNHLFPRSRTYLQGILPPYALEKNEFPFTVLALVKALS